jgi:hypothetical protein
LTRYLIPYLDPKKIDGAEFPLFSLMGIKGTGGDLKNKVKKEIIYSSILA